MTQQLETQVGGNRMNIFLAEPAGAGPHPAVILIHHRDGIDDFTRASCERLAKSGFVAAAPNLFHRRPQGEDTKVSRQNLRDPEVVADIAAAVKSVQGLKSVQPDKIGIMGHCMGGRMAYLGAASNPAFKAAVVLYGGGVLREEGAPAPITLTGNIKCAVAGFFGKEDTNPSPDQVATMSAELTKHKVRHDFRTYDATGHAFQDFTNPQSYREQSSEDAWSRLVPFLKTELA